LARFAQLYGQQTIVKVISNGALCTQSCRNCSHAIDAIPNSIPTFQLPRQVSLCPAAYLAIPFVILMAARHFFDNARNPFASHVCGLYGDGSVALTQVPGPRDGITH